MPEALSTAAQYGDLRRLQFCYAVRYLASLLHLRHIVGDGSILG